jgi:hypothetical protein
MRLVPGPVNAASFRLRAVRFGATSSAFARSASARQAVQRAGAKPPMRATIAATSAKTTVARAKSGSTRASAAKRAHANGATFAERR